MGEFTTDPADHYEDIVAQEDGSWLVDGSTSIRTLNTALQMSLSTDGPRTLNGLITEYLETIPESGTSLLLDQRPVDIIQIRDNMIKTVRIHAPIAAMTTGIPGQDT